MNRATKWLALTALGLAVAPATEARAQLILNAAQLTNYQVIDNPEVMAQESYVTNSYPQTGPTVVDTSTPQRYNGSNVFYMFAGSGSASVQPGPGSFSRLTFALGSASSLQSKTGTNTVAVDTEDYYYAYFTPAATGRYALSISLKAEQGSVYNPGGGTTVDNANASVTLTDDNGNNLAVLNYDSVPGGPSSPETLAMTLNLTKGAHYYLSGETDAGAYYGSGNIGASHGSASATFSLTAIPEPATIIPTGTALIAGLCMAWRRRRARAAA